jgi:hypothetical protein
MTTETDIANLALAVLDEAPIAAIADDNTAARLCNRHFAQTRKAELAKHDWAFAIKTDSVTGTDTGEGTLNWSYTYPTGALRILPLTYDGEPDGIPISWRQEGTVILSDQDSPRKISYIEDKTDPTVWPPLFTEVFVAALAIKITVPMTHKSGMLDVAKAAYQTALQDALLKNAIRSRGTLYTGSWAAQRGDNRYWRA